MLSITEDANTLIHHTFGPTERRTFNFWVFTRETVISKTFCRRNFYRKAFSKGGPTLLNQFHMVSSRLSQAGHLAQRQPRSQAQGGPRTSSAGPSPSLPPSSCQVGACFRVRTTIHLLFYEAVLATSVCCRRLFAALRSFAQTRRGATGEQPSCQPSAVSAGCRRRELLSTASSCSAHPWNPKSKTRIARPQKIPPSARRPFAAKR